MQSVYPHNTFDLVHGKKTTSALPVFSNYYMNREESIMSLKIFAVETLCVCAVAAAIYLFFA